MYLFYAIVLCVALIYPLVKTFQLLPFSFQLKNITFANFIKNVTMLRTHTCGELTISNLGQTVTLCGWVQKSRDLGGTTFIDVRDRYGLTQLVLNTDTDATLREAGRQLGREFVIKVTGNVVERSNKNTKIPTGEIEIIITELE